MKYTIHDRQDVCKNCLIRDYFFVGSGSSYYGICPKCGQDDTIMFGHLCESDKLRASELFRKMWNEKFNLED